MDVSAKKPTNDITGNGANGRDVGTLSPVRMWWQVKAGEEVPSVAFDEALRAWPLWGRLSAASAAGIASLGISYLAGLPAYGFAVLLLYPTVLGSAFYWGRVAGFACTLVCAVCLALVMQLDDSLPTAISLPSVGALILFILAGFSASVLISKLRRALRELKDAHTAAVSMEHEKDLLLRELRHRIKNDLANVSAILEIEARNLDDGAAAALRRAVDRIHVIARLHERMERDRHSPVVEAGAFLHELCSDYRSTFLAGREVKLEIDCAAFPLSAERAVSLGLIANELITNALKHAFPAGRPGAINIALSRNAINGELIVRDDGVGAPKRPTSGSGHRLIQALVRQLGANLERETVSNGTSWRLTFSIS
ncbi:sensor histidine kinase [Sphingobium sp. BS19]|uniref:sensor histidine kinase n=1 Tax=Sphingobium sp. BS19 TaxID=3018973 RepID=UPI0022ED616D|nr:sensor histidine kinase [Sphingobium sp. BS19]GLI98991.1 hypothetical protein Sbs19_28090 [Sphingobium sp. BS19]